MPLARIISHSLECAHELAASLEERGYAVEIVSPDAIPGHAADLELRVETSPDNVLTAKVQAHNGPRTASLDFVHYVNPPMPDFRQKPPEAVGLPPIPRLNVAAGPKPIAVQTVQPALPGPAPGPARVVPEAPVVLALAEPAVALPSADPSLEPVADEIAKAAPPDLAPKPTRGWPKIRIIISRADSSPGPSSGPRRKPKGVRRPASWFLRAAGTAAALLLAASLLSLGTMRLRPAITSERPDPGLTAPAQAGQDPSGQARTGQLPEDKRQTGQERTAADESSLSAGLNTSGDSASAIPALAAPAIDHSVVPAIETDKLKGQKSPSTASGVSAAASGRRAPPKPSQRQRTHHADVVAPDTITYFNTPGAKPIVVKPLPQHPVRSEKHDSVVAARSETALDAKAVPKAGSDKP